jgi:hypothetical protein
VEIGVFLVVEFRFVQYLTIPSPYLGLKSKNDKQK